MKKKILLLMGVYTIGLSLYAQVGINTLKPLGLLHIDPEGNTTGSSIATATSFVDDILISAQNGYMAIGALDPKAKLDIAGTHPISINVDDTGNIGDVLYSDDDGYGRWNKFMINAKVDMDNLGMKGAGKYDPTFGYNTLEMTAANNPLSSALPDNGFVPTGGYITIPTGTHMVLASFYNQMLFKTPAASGLLPSHTFIQIRYSLSSNPTRLVVNDTSKFIHVNTDSGNTNIPGLITMGINGINESLSQICTGSGFWIIQNNTNADIKAYLFVMPQYSTDINTANVAFIGLGSAYWRENIISVAPIKIE